MTSPAHLPAQIARVAAELGEGRSAGMRLRLDPPSLGEVRVQIEATGRGIDVRIVARSGEACALLSDRQSQLRDELWRSGLTLHSFSASVDSEAGSGAGARSGSRQPGVEMGSEVNRPDRMPLSGSELFDSRSGLAPGFRRAGSLDARA